MFPNIWILLDSCSSISSTSAVDLVRDIEQVKQPTRAWTNGAFIDHNLQCKLNILNGMTVYFNKNDITNILSLNELSDIYHVTMDTAKVKSIFFFRQKLWLYMSTGIASVAMTLFTNGVSLMMIFLNGHLTQLKILFLIQSSFSVSENRF